MRTSTLLARNLTWYWRTNLAVLLGVATATGILAGALEVGDSVRASLRDLVYARLGNAAAVIASGGFFREQLADVVHHLGRTCDRGRRHEVHLPPRGVRVPGERMHASSDRSCEEGWVAERADRVRDPPLVFLVLRHVAGRSS